MLVGLDYHQLENLDKVRLIELILALQQQLAGQGLLIQELRDQLAKDSHNSGKPPSSDGLKKPKTSSLRQSGQHPRGGQPGHQGDTLKMVGEPDHVERYAVKACPHCQTDLSAMEPTGHEKRQVVIRRIVCHESPPAFDLVCQQIGTTGTDRPIGALGQDQISTVQLMGHHAVSSKHRVLVPFRADKIMVDPPKRHFLLTIATVQGPHPQSSAARAASS